MTAQERIAAANRLDAARNGRPTAHCDDCGQLHCECPPAVVLPEPRKPEHDLETLAGRLAWERKVQA